MKGVLGHQKIDTLFASSCFAMRLQSRRFPAGAGVPGSQNFFFPASPRVRNTGRRDDRSVLRARPNVCRMSARRSAIVSQSIVGLGQEARLPCWRSDLCSARP